MKTEDIYSLAIEYRRYFHRHPEFAMQEFNTQKYITGILEDHHIDYQEIGTGIMWAEGSVVLPYGPIWMR